MTQTEHTGASDRRRGRTAGGASGEFDQRTRRALSERMAVTPLGGGTYEVATESDHSYVVDLEGGRCTCPDHTYRGARCKHLRRVAIDVSEGLLPPPGRAAAECEVCGAELFVDENAPGPHLCADHEFDVGDEAYDRNTGDRVLIVAPPAGRADEVAIRHGRTVADHYSNAEYPDDDAVVAAVYAQSVRITEDGAVPSELTVYSFPRSRLSQEPVERASNAERRPDDADGRRRNGAESQSRDAEQRSLGASR
ncbi:SWIM zinc finger family protein [Natronoarchaeum mannanilyticum]|uniref:SWIM-type domain-containing protein n=1 Tax=Natronoarchaeum mannanilyticum TaxID=926360 RepID=A0AAV3T8I0_9EURY